MTRTIVFVVTVETQYGLESVEVYEDGNESLKRVKQLKGFYPYGTINSRQRVVITKEDE